MPSCDAMGSSRANWPIKVANPCSQPPASAHGSTLRHRRDTLRVGERSCAGRASKAESCEVSPHRSAPRSAFSLSLRKLPALEAAAARPGLSPFPGMTAGALTLSNLFRRAACPKNRRGPARWPRPVRSLGAWPLPSRGSRGERQYRVQRGNRASMPQRARHVIVRAVGLAYGVEFVLSRLALFGRPEQRADHHQQQD